MMNQLKTVQTIDTSNLLKRADYNKKNSEIDKKVLDHNHGKYITTQEFNKLTGNNFAAILVKAKLSRIDDFVKETDYDKLKNN